MKIAIVGSGKTGAALGAIWAQKGHEVMFCFLEEVEEPDLFSQSSRQAFTGTIAEVLAFAEVVMLSVPYESLGEIITNKDAFRNKIVITGICSLEADFTGETIGLPTEQQISVAENIALALPGASVIEAFNTTFSEVLQLPARESDSIRPTVFYCGDNMEAKKVTIGLIEDCGYTPINAGNLRTARSMETFATAWMQFAVVAGLFPRISLCSLQY